MNANKYAWSVINNLAPMRREVFPADVDPADEDPIAANFWQFDTQNGFHRVRAPMPMLLQYLLSRHSTT